MTQRAICLSVCVFARFVDLCRVLWPRRSCGTLANGETSLAESRCHFVWPGLGEAPRVWKDSITPPPPPQPRSFFNAAPPTRQQQQPLPETPHCPELGIRARGEERRGDLGVRAWGEKAKLRGEEVAGRTCKSSRLTVMLAEIERRKLGIWQELCKIQHFDICMLAIRG